MSQALERRIAGPPHRRNRIDARDLDAAVRRLANDDVAGQ